MKNLLSMPGLLLASSRAFAQLSPADEAAIRRTVQRVTANYLDHRFADIATYTTSGVNWVNIMGMWCALAPRPTTRWANPPRPPRSARPS